MIFGKTTEHKMAGKETPEKCKTCPYALGYIVTCVDPCPRCMGETSIFGKVPPALVWPVKIFRIVNGFRINRRIN